jgi:Family of unknown function (DUF6510)
MNEMKLDGNAAAGTLEQLFAFEVTTAIGTCANCGAVGPVGSAMVYSQAPGIVMRCPACGAVLLRLANDGDSRYWLEMTGVRSLEIRL